MENSASLMDLQDLGLKMEYRCPSCKSCVDCRRGEQYEKVSIRQEADVVTAGCPGTTLCCNVDQKLCCTSREIFSSTRLSDKLGDLDQLESKMILEVGGASFLQGSSLKHQLLI